jgi:hypothetical protein
VDHQGVGVSLRLLSLPVAVDTLPLDLDGKAVTPSPLPPSAEIGRVEGLRGSQRVIAFCRRLGMAVTWKMPDATPMARGGYHRHVAFNRRPLLRPRGALAAAYAPAASRSVGGGGDPLGVGPAGENYQVRTILASAAYS